VGTRREIADFANGKTTALRPRVIASRAASVVQWWKGTACLSERPRLCRQRRQSLSCIRPPNECRISYHMVYNVAQPIVKSLCVPIGLFY